MTDANEATPTSEHLSDLLLDQLLTDELAGDELAAVRAHLEACDACRARERELRDDRAAFARSHLADDDKVPSFDGGDAKVVSLADYRRTRVTRALSVVASIAAVALVFVLVPRDDGVETPGVRTKGSAKLSFFVRDAAGVRAGANGEVVHADDQLRFVITSKDGGFAAVLSRDGAGAISVYAADRARLAEVAPGEHAFPRAVELDDVLGTERLYGFLCESRLTVAAVIAAVEKEPRSPTPPDGCVLDVLTIDKRAR
jgi:anti-sigma factor RsiW